MLKEEYVDTIIYNDIMFNIGFDDYGQQYFIEYLEDGKLVQTGCGAYNTNYMDVIEVISNELKKAKFYCKNCSLYDEYLLLKNKEKENEPRLYK